MELLVRTGDVSVCSVGGNEVDFMTNVDGNREYYQVAVNISDAKTMEREVGPLRRIRDNHPKTVVTLDHYPMKNIDGIRVVGIIDFLTGRE